MASSASVCISACCGTVCAVGFWNSGRSQRTSPRASSAARSALSATRRSRIASSNVRLAPAPHQPTQRAPATAYTNPQVHFRCAPVRRGSNSGSPRCQLRPGVRRAPGRAWNRRVDCHPARLQASICRSRSLASTGLESFREGEQPGRPRTLNANQWRKLEADLRKTPRDVGLDASVWDGPLLAEHLRRSYRVELGVRQCQRLFRRMGFRLRKPRPQIAQSDPVRVAAVKKTAALGKKKRS